MVSTDVSDFLLSASHQGREFDCNLTGTIKHNAINLSVFVLLIAGFALSLFGLSQSNHILLTVGLGVPLFSWFYFAAMILVVHEASHRMFLIFRNRRLTELANAFFGWLICLPLYQDYRYLWAQGHLLHHSDPLIAGDPQNCPHFTVSGNALLKALAKIWFIPLYAAYFQSSCPQSVAVSRRLWIVAVSTAVWVLIFALCVASDRFYLAVALLLAGNGLLTLNLIKVSIEHGGLLQMTDKRLRSRSSFFPLRHVLMPFNISIHFEHHLRPAVPWYNLKAYHDQVAANCPAELRHHLYNQGDVIEQILGHKRNRIAAAQTAAADFAPERSTA